MSFMYEPSVGSLGNIFMSLYLIFIKNNMDADNIIQKKNAAVQFTWSGVPESSEEITCVLAFPQEEICFLQLHLKSTQRI